MNLLIASIAFGLVAILVGPPRSVARQPSRSGVVSGGDRGAVTRVRGQLVRARERLRRSPEVQPAELAVWVDHLARALRHGSTLNAALTSVLPSDDAVADATRPLRRLLERGVSVVDACDDWSGELDEGSCRLLRTIAAVVGATAVVGGSSARPLEQLASALRQHASDDLERNAQSAQARLSARVLTIVPLGVLAFMLATDADVRAIIATSAGASVVIGGLIANVAGAWWMRLIVNGRSRRQAAA